MKIDFANLRHQYQLYKNEIDAGIQAVLNKANYIMGEEINELENELKNYTGSNHAISCSSGTDALLLAMMAMDIKPNDEIITSCFTFIATGESIVLLGAKPVFVDIDEQTYNIDPKKIEEKISDKTKAIMPVSLYGQPADMDAVQKIANKHGLKVIVDGAQSFGGTYKHKTDSALGDISITSFFPSKPLGCFGDGGAIFTNHDGYAEKMKSMRVHGQTGRYYHKYIGICGRLDSIQAAVLIAKLKHFPADLKLRQEVAQKYDRVLQNKALTLPIVAAESESAWAQYSIRIKNRDAVQARLKEAGVPTAVHYPKPLHLQECFSYLNYQSGDFPISEKVSDEILSLPMNPYLTDDEINYIGSLFE